MRLVIEIPPKFRKLCTYLGPNILYCITIFFTGSYFRLRKNIYIFFLHNISFFI